MALKEQQTCRFNLNWIEFDGKNELKVIIQTGSPLILIQTITDPKDIWLNYMKIYVSNNK